MLLEFEPLNIRQVLYREIAEDLGNAYPLSVSSPHLAVNTVLIMLLDNDN